MWIVLGIIIISAADYLFDIHGNLGSVLGGKSTRNADCYQALAAPFTPALFTETGARGHRRLRCVYGKSRGSYFAFLRR